MKIYLSQADQEDKNYRHFQNVAMFVREVLDTEANEIICDGFLSNFSSDELPQVINIICSKVRLNGEVVVKDLDFDLVARRISREELSVTHINQNILRSRSFKSLLTLEDVEQFVPEGFQVYTKGFDESMCEFVIRLRRVR
tara:strand:+ start:2493 stop:2915 length:423 start_codon:yes stop_codon:yes gene_type:complete